MNATTTTITRWKNVLVYLIFFKSHKNCCKCILNEQGSNYISIKKDILLEDYFDKKTVTLL